MKILDPTLWLASAVVVCHSELLLATHEDVIPNADRPPDILDRGRYCSITFGGSSSPGRLVYCVERPALDIV
jgi:hypothetical protein